MKIVPENIHQYSKIGIALSSEKNINKLFEMIVEEAMLLTNADAGTLYLLDRKSNSLRFEIVKNKTMNISLGGTSDQIITISPVPLYVNNKPNFSNVSSYVALTGRSVNIPNVYQTDIFDFTGPKKYDEKSGYRSISTLIIPMKNHKDKIIGVLQLLNAMDADGKNIIPFQPEFEELIASLASQAAVALNNVQLIKELTLLFYSFIKSIATAIDEKSPYTGGHIRRVTELTTLIAEQINVTDHGPFENVSFTEDQMEELKIAAWLHDVGKITTPESITDKMTRLESVIDRIILIETRFNLIREIITTTYLKSKIALLEKNGTDNDVFALNDAFQRQIKTVDNDLAFIKYCNNTRKDINDEMLARLEVISKKTYYHNGDEHLYLTHDEYKNLKIKKGTLTTAERTTIEHHAEMTLKITNQLPFPDHLSDVPKFASAHHERLDGSGYPLGLEGKDLPIQSRIIGIADIFEALTAKDRPYKGPMKLSSAVRVLEMMQDDNHIDADLLELFINSGIHKTYAEKELDKNQIDI